MIERPVRLIEIREFPEQRVLRICGGRMATKDIATFIPGALGEIHAYLQRAGARPTGAPYLVCPQPDADGKAEVELGWPVDRELPGEGRIEGGTLPGGRAACTEHRGTYDTIDRTYAALYEWIGRNGHTPAGPAREVYLTGPEVTDPERILTEVVAPIR